MLLKELLENKKPQKALVIAGFPGIGKSHLKKTVKDMKILDSDSSKFSWKKDNKKERNPEFPKNYIDHIKSNLNSADMIMVSTHDEVRKALEDNNIKYVLVYPDKKLKDEFIKRYEERGNDKDFIKFISNGWNKMLDNLQAEKFPNKIVLKTGQYLGDIVDELKKQK